MTEYRCFGVLYKDLHVFLAILYSLFFNCLACVLWFRQKARKKWDCNTPATLRSYLHETYGMCEWHFMLCFFLFFKSRTTCLFCLWNAWAVDVLWDGSRNLSYYMFLNLSCNRKLKSQVLGCHNWVSLAFITVPIIILLSFTRYQMWIKNQINDCVSWNTTSSILSRKLTMCPTLYKIN